MPDYEDAIEALSGFVEELRRVMSEISWFLGEHHPDPELRHLYGRMEGPIYRRSDELLAFLSDQNQERSEAVRTYLRDHGLEGGSEELALKLRGFYRYLEAWNQTPDWQDTETPAEPRPDEHDQGQRRRRRLLPGKKTVARLLAKWPT